jgi:urocanate hydratase
MDSWDLSAGKHGMVVGSQARILYADQKGRTALAVAFNQAVADGKLSAPIVISRDHHDVSGTDRSAGKPSVLLVPRPGRP